MSTGPPRLEDKDLRPLVAFCFVPGLYLCLAVSAILSLAVAGAFFVFVAWLVSLLHSNMIPSGALVAVVIGGAYGVWVSVKACVQSVRRARVLSQAMRVDPAQAPGLHALLQDLAKRMGCPVPDHVIVELGPGFFVTEAEVVTFEGKLKGRTLCLSAPLMRILSVEELRAIVAHEFAHFTGADTSFSKWFYPVYRGTSTALVDLGGMGSSGNGAVLLPLILPTVILGSYMRAFTRVESRISRSREARADAHAASETSAHAIAGALQKVYALSPLWSASVTPAMVRLLNDGGRAFINASEWFLERCRGDRDLIGRVLADSANVPTHPTDRHPALKERLAALGQPLGAPTLSEGVSSAGLFADLDAIERALTDRATALVAYRHPEVDRSKLGESAAA